VKGKWVVSQADLPSLTACQAAAKIAAGETSSLALVEACLERISASEAEIAAWSFIDRTRALEAARAADAALREGKGVGLLHGVPVGIKDIIDTADMPTEFGSLAFKGRWPPKDAMCVTALRRAGAVILGKTITTELANLAPAATRNPRNREHTPGGSSSGSAAAVAAGMVSVTVGTQTGGSVIRPAAFCGVCGFKPTLGVIPRAGVLMQSHSLDTVGVFARAVEDLALLADAMQGFDALDRASLSTSRPRLLATATEDWPLPPLFAFVKTHAWKDADPGTHAAFGELLEHLGGQVQEIAIDHTTELGCAAASTVQGVELATYYGPWLDRTPELFSPLLRERIEAGRRIKGTDYLAALNARETYYDTVEGVLRDYGTILTPATPGPAPRGLSSTGNPVFCAFWTYLGVPAVSLPLLEVAGLPLGVQLVGARRDDGRLLRSARRLMRSLA
jgi:Asp-tRNA(Asn)/Glu-tRNA(Gln) amidotransferase A subunit family amidase